ncbi:MAG: hypothetical protein HOW73_50250 [Polyangiaceae bacterium]|nr:hypothetical protein [Polyangiaceae bacterium]
MTTTTPGGGTPTNEIPVVARPAEPDVTRRTLETIPDRTHAFLRTVGTEPEVRALLQGCGYDQAEHEVGWGRLREVSGMGPAVTWISDEASRLAITELDESDEKIFRIATASLQRFPAQAEYVLEGIGPVKGAGAVINMEVLLDRIDAMATGNGRDPATRDQDQAAVALLAKRGINEAARARFRALITTAKQANPVSPLPTNREERERDRVAKLMHLREWYAEWAEIAKAVVTRRDHLIRMGLGSQRRSAAAEEEEETTPAAPSPAPGAPAAGGSD